MSSLIPASGPSRLTILGVTALSLVLLAASAGAQENRPPGEGPGGRGPRGEGGPMRAHPVVAALDTDGDGTISAAEIAAAPAALRKLDKNGDGKLSEDEIRPAFGRGGRGGGPGGQGPNPEDTVRRLLEFDKNGDGKLSKDELPERMQGMIQRADTDKDGVLSKAELTAMAQAQSQAQQSQGEPGGGRRREGGPARE